MHEEYYAVSADSDSKEIRTSRPKDLAKQSLKENPDNLTSIKQHTFSKNLKQTPRYSKLTSYVESLRLFLISLLFSANAYAQTITPTAFIHLEYSYDGVGNVTGIIDHTDSQNTRSMQYDGLDRLTGATGVWGSGSFNYDPIGNRTKKSIGLSSSNYSYGASDNRLSGYSHDANGNLLQDDNYMYEYDSENRLVTVRSGASVIAEYQYDGEGRRIKKVANGETTYYAYGTGLNVLTELNGQGVPKYDYIYAGNRNVARVNFDENGAVQNKSFYHTDHLGSALAMTDETTTVIWNQNYLPFGEPHGGSGNIENSRQYTGKEFEEETGLYYYGARYYHSGLGRFMSVDPAPADPTDPQSWNRYAYVLNNPYKYVDPDGEMSCSVIPEGVETSPDLTCGAIGGGGRQLALPSGPRQLALPKPSFNSFKATLEKYIFKGPGVNITPRSVANRYRFIGKGNRTFITNVESVEKVIGPLKEDRITITSSKARELERALGLRKNSLESRNIISMIDDIASRAPGLPIQGNENFLGGGKGLPTGAPELTISGINSAGGGGIRQIILEVR